MSERFPNLRIVLDHVMLPPIKDENYGLSSIFRALAARDNVYVKWTCINMDVAYVNGVDSAKLLRAVVDFFGADKVMWGSDIGTSSGTYKEMVQRGIDSTSLLTEEERAKVLHDTGRRVFRRP